jgi:hypothetical protein
MLSPFMKVILLCRNIAGSCTKPLASRA